MKSLFNKRTVVRRIWDEGAGAVVYVSYSTRFTGVRRGARCMQRGVPFC